MKKLGPILFVVLILSGCRATTVPTLAKAPDRLSIYEKAEIVTGTSSAILRGIAYAESSYRAAAKHPDPLDKGLFGLHEAPAYHRERAAKWGEYDATNPQEAAIIAGMLFQENLRILGREDLAIAAHYQGPTGVKKYGPCHWYVRKVLGHE